MIDSDMDTQQHRGRVPSTALILTMGIIVIGTGAIAALALREHPLLRTGMIEAKEYDVASKIPGRVASVTTREGGRVTVGQELFRLSDREVNAKVAQAKGAVDVAKAQLDMALNGARPRQITMVERKTEAARSQFELAQATLRRMKSLHRDALISDQQLDVTLQKYQAASAGLAAVEAELAMVRDGTRSEEQRMARGQYDRALQALEEAESYLDESVGVAPITGVVTRLYAEVGELVATGYPVVSILDSEDAWAELNLPETELHYLRTGDSLSGLIRGLGVNAEFRVENIAAMADFANWRAQDDRGTFEVRSFTVTLRPLHPIPGLRPGMTVQFELPRG